MTAGFQFKIPKSLPAEQILEILESADEWAAKCGCVRRALIDLGAGMLLALWTPVSAEERADAI